MDTHEVRFGGVAGASLDRQSDTLLRVAAPSLAPGAHDVVVDNGDAQGTVPGGYVAYDPNETTLELLGLVPNRVSTLGGTEVVLVGSGFQVGASVVIGTTTVAVASVSGHFLKITLPAGFSAGAHAVSVTVGIEQAHPSERRDSF